MLSLHMFFWKILFASISKQFHAFTLMDGRNNRLQKGSANETVDLETAAVIRFDHSMVKIYSTFQAALAKKKRNKSICGL